MRLCGEQVGVIAVFTIILFLAMSPSAAAQGSFKVETTTVKVYRDGLAHIMQTLTVDEILLEINLPLLSLSSENFIVLDENKLAVDYQLNNANLTVFTLGASKISVEYDTATLTNKNADVWTLIMETPHNLTVVLPLNSTVVYLNQVPTAIDTTGSELSLSLNPGRWEISYVVPLLQEIPNEDGSLGGIPTEYLIVAVLGVVVAVVIVMLVFLRKRRINVKKIQSQNPTLMKEDIAVIEFLAEKEGKAFEAEIRQRFPDMPRTSLWRLIRRLEGLEIVEVKKIGLENQVQLKK